MLDTAVYLSSFGWQGKGNGLRQGSVSRPLAIPQKRTLSGLGKDRDDAFPFWDHLFAAASKSIKIKVSGDSEDEAVGDDTALSNSSLHRTATGILSNRRPVSGTPASSGAATPTDQAATRLGLIATAKRESARKRLYAGFFRGPVLGPEIDPPQDTQLAPIALDTSTTQALNTGNANGEIKNKKRKHEGHDIGNKNEKLKQSKTSKRKETNTDVTVVKERKRKKHRDAESQVKLEENQVSQIPISKDRTETSERRQRKEAKLERRRRKEERRKATGREG